MRYKGHNYWYGIYKRSEFVLKGVTKAKQECFGMRARIVIRNELIVLQRCSVVRMCVRCGGVIPHLHDLWW